jgi:integrase
MKNNTKNQHRHVTRNGKGPVIFRKYSVMPDGSQVYDQYYTRRIVRNAKQYYFKLGTNQRDAEKRSNDLDKFLQDPMHSIHDAVVKFNPDKAERMSACKITIKELIEAHEEVEPTLELKDGTAHHYRTALMRAVRTVIAYRAKKPRPDAMLYKDSLEAVSDFPVSHLNDRFISDLKMAEMKAADGSISEQGNIKRRLKSVMADARSVLCPSALEEYAAQGLKLPDVEPFMKTVLFKRVTKKRYRLPPVEVIAAIQRDMGELRENLNAYRMFLLAMGAGLRKREIRECRQSWIVGGDQPTVFIGVTEDWEQKSHGESCIELCEWAYKELMNCMDDGAMVITGTVTDAADASKFLCAWLRSKGLDRHKPTHELRMLYGSWVANRRGLFVAQKLLRHKDAQVTSDSYSDLIADEKILQFWDKEAPKKKASKSKSKRKKAS